MPSDKVCGQDESIRPRSKNKWHSMLPFHGHLQACCLTWDLFPITDHFLYDPLKKNKSAHSLFYSPRCLSLGFRLKRNALPKRGAESLWQFVQAVCSRVKAPTELRGGGQGARLALCPHCPRISSSCERWQIYFS